MGLSYANGFLALVVIGCLFANSNADTIVVGGPENWRYGFNYTDWSLKHGPLYLNDTLVFKYDPPSNTIPPQTVYLLPNLWSFAMCDFKRAKLLANETLGSGDGFEFLLKRVKRPLYFASGEGINGTNCKDGQMKFFAWPLPRY